MNLRADFHIHTHYSYDSSLPPSEIVKRARELKLDIIGVADHGTCMGALGTKKIAKNNPLVLIGQEIKTREGEILVFGIENNLKEGKDLKETCKEAKRVDGLIIAPHPFDKFRRGIGDSINNVLEYIDAIEGLNSMCTFDSFNTKAREFALEHDIPIIAGSDAHFKNEIGKAMTGLNCKKNQKSIFDAIRKGRTEIIGERISIKKRIGSRIIQKLKKH